MINRDSEKLITKYLNKNRPRALLITGSRQVGKTYTIRKVASNFSCFIEFNLSKNTRAKIAIQSSKDPHELLTKLASLTSKKTTQGQTLIFLDDVQDCPEIFKAIEMLVMEGSYQYILAGTYVQAAQTDYMTVYKMYPINFIEFLMAHGINKKIIDTLEGAYKHKTPIEHSIRVKIMVFFKLYLVVGGMPAVVKKYLQTHNLHEVRVLQKRILKRIETDLSKRKERYLNEIVDLIPTQLNAANKRFFFKSLNKDFKFSRYKDSFEQLENMGITIPIHACKDSLTKIKLDNLFKLFFFDVGLLAAMYPATLQFDVFEEKHTSKYGVLVDNYVAQELISHDYDTCYYNDKKYGEVDFMIKRGNVVLPIEVKWGKAFKKHSALTNLFNNDNNNIKHAYIYHNDNLKIKNKKIYLPIYMISFLEYSGEVDI